MEHKHLTRDIIKTRNIVKQKLKNLRLGTSQAEAQLQSQYKPIIKSLQDIAGNLSTINVKQEIKNEPKEEMDEIPLEGSTGPTFLNTDVVAETNNDDVFSRPEEEGRPSLTREDILSLSREPAFTEYLEQYDPLPRQYIEEMVTDENDLFDFKYGVRHDVETDKFFIGNSEIKIDGKDLIIDNLKYTGTPGLYELLFKKQPLGYTENDRRNYSDIVKRTNAARRHYSEGEQISGSRGYKYTNIIAPMLDPRRTALKKIGLKYAKGYFKNFNEKPVEYIYWDNLNELVDRLRLLIASRDAGHTGHDNEIISIIEELKEAKVIE